MTEPACGRLWVSDSPSSPLYIRFSDNNRRGNGNPRREVPVEGE